jgi:hypothetical protein
MSEVNFMLFSSTRRPHELLDYCADVDPAVAWRAIHEWWTACDAIPHDGFADLFTRHRRGWRPDYLGEEDRAFYDSLPDRLTVYRGQCASKPIGLSWTRDKATALEFARGHRGIRNERPVVYAARIRKTQIAGAYTARKEAEVVTFSTPSCAWPIARGEWRATL